MKTLFIVSASVALAWIGLSLGLYAWIMGAQATYQRQLLRSQRPTPQDLLGAIKRGEGNGARGAGDAEVDGPRSSEDEPPGSERGEANVDGAETLADEGANAPERHGRDTDGAGPVADAPPDLPSTDIPPDLPLESHRMDKMAVARIALARRRLLDRIRLAWAVLTLVPLVIAGAVLIRNRAHAVQ